MLVLNNIVKVYKTGDTEVHALKDVSLAFRKNEFVSILGHSGCGKTTLLNIIGGLDRYTSGVMSVNGISTDQYKDCDWDAYRNHSIGFVFQTYNLIPHQTVLANVELALTLSGVSKAERRRRAVEVLTKVGLGDQINKKPNQMSGGQMQRVAIARALINDPEILLADEPTGALDTDTSVQIMEILKDISKEKLIIMVTHNPELAEQYSDRIVRLSDGKVVEDSMPYSLEDEATEYIENTESVQPTLDDAPKSKKIKKKAKPSMSFLTALTLSFNNLLTKKARTILTSVAGSIGIIGIALILSLSTGINAYIERIQRETLASYPITIQKSEVNYSSILAAVINSGGNVSADKREPNKIYVNTAAYDMVQAVKKAQQTVKINNLKKFKSYIAQNDKTFSKYAEVIKYGYNIAINAYLQNEEGKYYKADVNSLFSKMATSGGLNSSESSALQSGIGSFTNIWQEMLPPEYGNDDKMHSMIKEQYDLVAGKWPTEKSEILLVMSPNNTITEVSLYTLGMLSDQAVFQMFSSLLTENNNPSANDPETDISALIPEAIDYSDFIYDGEGDQKYVKYNLVPTSDYFFRIDESSPWVYLPSHEGMGDEYDAALNRIISESLELKICGIIRKNPEATAGSLSGTLVYTTELTDYLLNKISASGVVHDQKSNENIDIFTGLPFVDTTVVPDSAKPADFISYLRTYANVNKKVQIYNAIFNTPTEEMINAQSDIILKSIGNGINENTPAEEMLNMIALLPDGANYVKLLQGCTSREIYETIKAYAKQAAKTNVVAALQAEANAIMNTPSKEELNAEKAYLLIDMIYAKNPETIRLVAHDLAEAIQQFSYKLGDIYNAVIDQLINQIDTMEPLAIKSTITSVIQQITAAGGANTDYVNFIVALHGTDYGITSEVQKQYIIDYYRSYTGIDTDNDGIPDVYPDFEEFLNGKSIYSAFCDVLDIQAPENYALYRASAQSATAKNAKLAAALMPKIEALYSQIDPSNGANDPVFKKFVDYHNQFVDRIAPSTLEQNYAYIGLVDKDDPSYIAIYPRTFEDKDMLAGIISDYNAKQQNDDRISYTDYIGLILSSVTLIINAITYVLIFFVSISLVVSSIMIGIITYISVLERTKEIGILRAIGASKRDVSRVFNAETLIVGFASGMIGIIVTLLLNIPIGMIIKSITDISGLTVLPIGGAVVLVLISMALTFVAGLIPSKIAATRDPVESLRTE